MSSPRFALPIMLATLVLAACQESSAPSEPTAARSLAVTGASTPLVFRQVSAGTFFTCGVTTSNVAYCWGTNPSGQLGRAGVEASAIPLAVAGGLQFRQVDAGGSHACGVTIDDRAYCWGSNALGQLGDKTVTTRFTPVAVTGGHHFRSIAAGTYHTCAIASDGAAWCWGFNQQGQVGNLQYNKRTSPTPVQTSQHFKWISAGALHSCGVALDDRAWCWGDNAYGEIGNNTTGVRRLPTLVVGGLRWRQVRAGDGSGSMYSTCGVTTTNRAYCWGGNVFGKLGDGTELQRNRPTAVAGGLAFNSISPGDGHTCGVTTGQAAYCWGNNYGGQLGDGGPTGTLAHVHRTPSAVVGGIAFATVTVSQGHSCGVAVGGKAWCWGGGYAIGTGDPVTVYSSPQAVAGP
jgi:alpha-tubulin suppressor-like RCC1 family protein